MADPTSWILELRELLRSAPQLEPIVEGSERRAVLVGLFVEAGGLWVLMRQDSTGGEALLPGAPVAVDEDVWDAAIRGGSTEGGVPAEAVLRLGELAPLELPDGGLLVPCVAALPVAAAEAAMQAAEKGMFKVPLQAFGNPTLVEEFMVEPEDGPARRMRAVHVGSRRIWGLGELVMEDLLERLQGE